jgi:hypothetical protein
MSKSEKFVLMPFEHEGIEFSSLPHAKTTIDVGGTTRRFLLKYHDGVLYFKEPHRAPIFAIPQIFEAAKRDEDALIRHFKTSIKDGNYGRFVSRQFWFPKIGGATILCVIHRADRSGWVKEWINDEWLDLKALSADKHLDLWASSVFLHYANRRAASHLVPKILEGTIEPEKRCDIPRKWLRGSEAEYEEVLLHVLKLWEPELGLWGEILMQLFPQSPLTSGEILEGGYDTWHNQYPFSSRTRRMFSLLQEHFAFTELRWQNAHIKPWKLGINYRDEDAIKRGYEKYGVDWRGNWYLDSCSHIVKVPSYPIPTAHEKLESALFMQEWLADKLPVKRAAKLLDEVVDG